MRLAYFVAMVTRILMEASSVAQVTLQSYFIPGATHPRPEQHYVEHKVSGEREKARRNHCVEHHLCGFS